VDYGFTFINSLTFEEFAERTFESIFGFLNPEIFPACTLEVTVLPAYSEERNEAAHLFYNDVISQKEEFELGFSPYHFKEVKLVEVQVQLREHSPMK
jgi:hypothetical protein